jgi:hypothetical protein
MKFLLVAKQEKNALAFIETIRCLVERGHDVTVAVQERDDERDQRLAWQIGSDRFHVVRCPSARIDEWAPVASLIRRLRDGLQYLRPPFAEARALRARIFHKLRQEFALEIEGEALAAGLRLAADGRIDRLDAVLRLAEHGVSYGVVARRVPRVAAP